MDPRQAYEQVFGAGAPFELAEEVVLGERVRVIKRRPGSLRELLQASAVHGDKEYVVQEGRRITYATHLQQVGRIARNLQDRLGIGPGDRVAILAANCPEWILSYWAVVSLGGIVVALNGWWTRDEIEYGLSLSEPRLLIGDEKRLARLEGSDPGVETLVIERDFASLEKGGGAPLPDQPIAEDDPALILFTSGTTGRPKGALISHRGLIGFVQLTQAGGFYGMLVRGAAPDPDALPACALLTVPLFHVSGLFAGCMLNLALGTKTVWTTGRFDPVNVLRLIEAERVTQWAGLGSMGPRVLNHPDLEKYDLSSLRNLGAGGAPISPAYLRRITEVAPNGANALGIGYGSSESVAVIASSGGEEMVAYPDSTGRVNATFDVEIRGPDEAVLPEAVEGEIHVRSPYTMLEYWRNIEATKSTLKPGRWLATGDIGKLVDGRLYINSRARDMILRAAENIYPIEIESRLELHPNVREAAVIGVDHPELGQEVKAVVVLEPGHSTDPDALAAWCAEKLAAFKVPSHWEIRSEPLPRNAAGKVVKTVLTGEAAGAGVEE
ncbi:MAG: class I adenylate-forming enzyme family protein [Myxococcota bacterium]|nr:class I adenylate-forming enzyme family protein [Myxococcota bacterium]